MEVSEYLVGSPAFKAGGTGDPRTAGSIPVHLRFLHPITYGVTPNLSQVARPRVRGRDGDEHGRCRDAQHPRGPSPATGELTIGW